MKHKSSLWLLVVITAFSLASCEVAGGIFKAGFWAAIIMIVAIAALILWLLRKFRR